MRTPGTNPAAPEDTATWLTALVPELVSAGLTADLNQTPAGLDVTASLQRPGHKPTDVIVDEDGYCEIHWWTGPDTTPAETAATIARAVAAVTGSLPRRIRTPR